MIADVKKILSHSPKALMQEWKSGDCLSRDARPFLIRPCPQLKAAACLFRPLCVSVHTRLADLPPHPRFPGRAAVFYVVASANASSASMMEA